MSARHKTALFVLAFALGCLAAGLRPFPASGVPMGGACRRASLVGADYRHGQWWHGVRLVGLARTEDSPTYWRACR